MVAIQELCLFDQGCHQSSSSSTPAVGALLTSSAWSHELLIVARRPSTNSRAVCIDVCVNKNLSLHESSILYKRLVSSSQRSWGDHRIRSNITSSDKRASQAMNNGSRPCLSRKVTAPGKPFSKTCTSSVEQSFSTA
jgi:hypothetical protein